LAVNGVVPMSKPTAQANGTAPTGSFAADTAVASFKDAMRAAGLEPPAVIIANTVHRFPGKGKRPPNCAGWCYLFGDGLGGCFGDWSSGLRVTWQAKRTKPRSPLERADFVQQIQEAARLAEQERRILQAQAATRAANIWRVAQPAPVDHPYLVRKRIRPHGARLHNHALVLAVVDFSGRLCSLQFIDGDGTKRLLRNGRKQGCVIHVAGDMADATLVVICEGWATGCTLAEDAPSALVLSAIDAGNLEVVAVAARARWPSAKIVIAGDDDRLTPGNPGATKALAAAVSAGALRALPTWPPNAPPDLTDFNDLVVWSAGGEA